MKVIVTSAMILFASLARAQLPFLAGVNTAGYDFSVVSRMRILKYSGWRLSYRTPTDISVELVWTHLSHNTLISQPKVLTFIGSVSPMVSLVYTTVSCLFLQHLVWHEEVKNSRILIGFLILAWQLMTPTLGSPLIKHSLPVIILQFKQPCLHPHTLILFWMW